MALVNPVEENSITKEGSELSFSFTLLKKSYVNDMCLKLAHVLQVTVNHVCDLRRLKVLALDALGCP